MLSFIGTTLLIAGYSSAFYIRVQINRPDTEREFGPFFLCRNLINPPPNSNELTVWAIDPLITTCAAEGGSPEFLIKKPSADGFDFYDELKRDGKIPYNPKTFYIGADEPWGTNYNVPIMVVEKAFIVPLALATHIFEPQVPANFEAMKGGKVRKDITEENPPDNGDVLEFVGHPTFPNHEKGLRIDLRKSKYARNAGRIPIVRDDRSWPADAIPDRPQIVLTVSNEKQFQAVVEGDEDGYLMAEKLAAYENAKINAKSVIGGFFGGIKNKIASQATNLKDKVGAGLAKIRNYRQEESKDDYPEPQPNSKTSSPDPAEKGGNWKKEFNLDYDMDPEWMGPVPQNKPQASADDEQIPLDAPLDVPLDVFPANKEYTG
ncbi:hypothetical protein TWF730_008066 [Orbilia blumenaviensis]|uniref:Uncharacterized protein n=1 Tax=Orbilia blumenaviensis TaxID=1796055 RepID=A0AAV9VC38_9PEZI